jgi:fructose-1,6-bisphosphatase/sedoheptulose 1,7-bisphosphatase-like protein
MQKLVVGAGAAGRVDLDAPIRHARHVARITDRRIAT